MTPARITIRSRGIVGGTEQEKEFGVTVATSPRVSGVTPSKMRGGQPVTGLNLACEAVIEPPFSVCNVLVPPNFLSNLPDAAEYEA